jgi:ribonuclease R
VLVHRILQECLDNKIEIDKKLEDKCRHSSERERAAMESERAANKYKQVEYMQGFLGEEFEGVISGVASFGFWVETVEHKCEGLVSINSLSEYDDFRHMEADYCLAGRRTGRQFRMGDKVMIKIVAANLAKRQLDYEWVIAGTAKAENPEDGQTTAKGPKPSKELKTGKSSRHKDTDEKSKEKKHKKKKK